MADFFDFQKPASITEIEELEKYSCLNFPTEYINHLYHYNGGQCSPNNFDFLEDGKISSSAVDWFLATRSESEDWGSLRDYIDVYKLEEKRIPSNFLPIAFDAGGNLICISCSGIDIGKIFFWDHETESDEEVHCFNTYFISNSLSEFINSMYSI